MYTKKKERERNILINFDTCIKKKEEYQLTLDKGQIKEKNAFCLSFYLSKRFCACDVSLSDSRRWITKRRRR